MLCHIMFSFKKNVHSFSEANYKLTPKDIKNL